MIIETINITLCEPKDPESVGGFEWRVDGVEADRVFEEFCKTGSRVEHYTGVTVPKHLREDVEGITEFVDRYYWSYPEYREVFFGVPARVRE